MPITEDVKQVTITHKQGDLVCVTLPRLEAAGVFAAAYDETRERIKLCSAKDQDESRRYLSIADTLSEISREIFHPTRKKRHSEGKAKEPQGMTREQIAVQASNLYSRFTHAVPSTHNTKVSGENPQALSTYISALRAEAWKIGIGYVEMEGLLRGWTYEQARDWHNLTANQKAEVTAAEQFKKEYNQEQQRKRE